MKRLIMLTLLLIAIPMAAQIESNPFAKPSALQFEAPAFNKISDADYQPAIEEGMKRELAEIEAIANSTDPPTLANTIEAMERSGALLRRVQRVFGAMTQANTNPTLQKIQAEEAPKLSAHRDAIYLNPKLFARVKAIYDQRASLNLDPESKQLVERYHRDFVRAGALLSDADKATLTALNSEQSKLTTDYRKRVLAATSSGALALDNRSELDGLPDADIAAAAEAAKSRNLAGKFVITLQNTTQQPPQTYLKNRALRERLFHASADRCNGGPSDTRTIVARLAQIRAQRAKLLGYPNYAAFGLDDQMAKTPDNAIKLMTDMVPAATRKARGEASKMQQLIDKEGAGFKLQPWDWQYYAEQVRKAEYDLDESQVRPYFELDRVLRDGVFFAANKLYGLTFKERKDIPVYQADVRVFDVFDADGKPLALFYGDFFTRDNKSGGAWTGNFVGQSRLLGTHPVVYNVENFTKPAPGQPALLSFSDVTTMFHEFGHALHGIFSTVKYPTLSGTPRDFVEFPSQFNEHWALEPAVFANYAKHYQTGKPMPADLVDKIKKSRTFNQGFATTEYLAAALLDMAWHALPADAPMQDVNGFEPEALKRYSIDIPEVPPRYRTTYFSHVWGGGYSAGYYAYLWSEVLDDDAYYWFRENGGMTRANGQRFREMILSRGGTQDPAALYRAFRGRDPVVQPLLEQRGLISDSAKPQSDR
ncbi:MAG: dipeptidyl carboxypeptidase II [Acidobacteria bacterium]|nr:MAG: dipeptidyl carboxypeptidase II [Acidobacteriota bacterium]